MAQQQEAAAGLVRRLGSASPAEQLQAARGLAQLAAAPGGAQRILLAGGVPALVRLLDGASEEDLQTAAAGALLRMAQQERGVAMNICTAGAGRALAQSLPSSRSPELTWALLELFGLLSACGEQQLLRELVPSPVCVAHLAQLGVDPSQNTATQTMALQLLAGPVLATSRSAVAAAAAPHAAAIVQRLLPEASREQQYAAATLVLLLADDPELAARMVAAGVMPALVGLVMRATTPQLQPLQWVALGILQRLVQRQPNAASWLAVTDGVAEMLVQLMASQPPPGSYQQAWGSPEDTTSGQATALLWHVSTADAALAGKAVAAGALPQLARVMRWGAPRLEWLASRGLWEDSTELYCTNACGGLVHLLFYSRPSAVTPALQAELLPLVQQVLQHSRGQEALRRASQLLALLRDPGIQSVPTWRQHVAEVARQLQPGGHPDRAAAIAALLAELPGGAQQQQQAVGSSAAPAAAGPSGSSEATQQAVAQQEAAPAECAACHALPPAGRKFQVCAGCRAVRYCSPACQKAGWRSGHKVACRWEGRASRAQGGA
jgi:hypothetical protein